MGGGKAVCNRREEESRRSAPSYPLASLLLIALVLLALGLVAGSLAGAFA